MAEKSYEVKIHPEAVKSIEQIYFITAEVSLTGAMHVVNDIYEVVYSLRQNPERFQIDFDLEFPYRRILVRQYKILFTINEPLNEVLVLLVWNTKANPARLKARFRKKD